MRAPSFVLSPHSNKSNINSEHNSASLEFSSVGPGSLPAWHTDSQRSADFREEGDVVVTCHHLRKEGALTHTSKFVSASCKKSFPEQKWKVMSSALFSLPTYTNQAQSELGLTLSFCPNCSCENLLSYLLGHLLYLLQSTQTSRSLQGLPEHSPFPA